MYNPYNQRIKYFSVVVFIGFFLLFGCASSRLSKFDSRLNNGGLKNSFHGLVVVDSKTAETIHNSNGGKYFTPASNVKIVTLYTGLRLLPKNLPTLKYGIKNDTLYAEGTGDPTWLHPYFNDTTAIALFKKYDHLALYLKNSEENRFGPGWAWEDYDTYFSPQKSTLPLYGNVVTISNNNALEVSPHFLLDKVSVIEESKQREEFANQFYIKPNEQDTLQVPFITSNSLTKKLLEEALEKNVTLVDSFPLIEKEVLYGIATDSVYKQMLYESDNFLAEQLLMVGSSTLSDTLSTQTSISHMLENEFMNLEHKPRWVDGSGLSRYNLFTPRSMVQILQKIYAEIPEERLFQIFPMWDSSGTTATWKNPDVEPYIFAKSGSLGNNYNLSGYLKTKSGKILIFSFMNNHFTIPTSQIRIEIEAILNQLREKN
ncbi:D-alanyl-D-alanine carboxypeptidase [Flagellimonas sp. CMM7]|uniref:D-alanyl-D-alanine carboxypeptidase n=1 Tax=Flagellimonas sp. CMM7 TaxID=2654676 RepID=UPI0013D57008|nr:D-alanyl-D-alanine carboxypeptidase [Flagellimonas sp. CMM7]UII79052.1 D-alanyl-D-alanine carboxypeptidase [Flagellimonas sp. CMM7]